MEFIAANMAPLMFGSLVLFMLFGYPVAFALAANGIVFGLIGIELGMLTRPCFRPCLTAFSVSCPMTHCWPSPSSPSWA
jgi:TRAP-type mannitol/chloroaromatic compound transport system permease large subunit